MEMDKAEVNQHKRFAVSEMTYRTKIQEEIGDWIQG